MTRRYGQIIRVSEDEIGSALIADTAAGAAELTVRNAADFDEDRGGKLSINGQVITYTKVDDDTGLITLNGTLAADADEGDQVALYDTKRDVIVVEKTALVEVGEGKSDAIHATIAAHLLRQLSEGPRGDDGESVVIERDEDGDWTVIDVLGLGDPSASGLQAEADDSYVLTAADIAAGVATMPLSHRPADEWLVAFWNGVPQEPTEYTINYDDQTITWPLPSWVKAGDRLWVHYAYRKGINTPPATDDPPPGLPLLGWYRLNESSGTALLDSSGHGNHGAYIGTVNLGKPSLVGDSDAAAEFVGRTGFGQVPGESGTTALFLNGLTSLGVEAVIKPSKAAGYQIVSRARLSSGYSDRASWQFTLECNGAGKLAANVFLEGADVPLIVEGPALAPAVVHRVGFEFRDGALSVKYGGAVVATATTTATLRQSCNRRMGIGADAVFSGGDTWIFEGVIDEVKIWGA